jgi:hypothetical protein
MGIFADFYFLPTGGVTKKSVAKITKLFYYCNKNRKQFIDSGISGCISSIIKPIFSIFQLSEL